MSSQAARTLEQPPRAASPDEGEHRAALVRARRFIFVAIPAWLLGIHVDVLAAASLVPGSLARLLTLRLIGVVVIAGAWAAIRFAPDLSRRAFRVLLVGAFASVAALFGFMGATVGGLTTPYFGGALVVLASYTLVSNGRWQEGMLDLACVATGFPAALAASALVNPFIASQLTSAHERAVLLFDLNDLATMYAIAVLGGHVAWSLRRQVFEARSLGRYKLKERIGAGGMGEVWVAYHHGLKRDVAVKILRTAHLRDAQKATLRFEREVRATTELTHPNTVRILDYGVTDDGLWYYVMELLVGENLAQLVEKEGALPPARALHLVQQAARALAEAHAKGIVHRDVKPENLVVTQAGLELDFVKVVDFGIAKVVKGTDDATLTGVGKVLGTPLWLPPEGFAARPLGPAADVYALGAVLHLLLSGSPPFDADSLAGLANAHLNVAPPPLPATVPADVAAIVARCLAKRPEERFASAGELAVALGSCVAAGTWQPARPSDLRVGPRPADVDVMAKTEVERTTP